MVFLSSASIFVNWSSNPISLRSALALPANGQAVVASRDSSPGYGQCPSVYVTLYMRIFLTDRAHICSTIESLTTALGRTPAFLANFTNLKTLELDFSNDGLATQSQRAELLAQSLPATLTVIRLVCLPRIDPHILGLIAARCPALETLDTTTLERLDISCCWVCLEESSTCMVHSPIPDKYPDARELSVVSMRVTPFVPKH